ncbi:MAG: LamG domain-containing protein, partial [Armatimonadetes bacterium]|nr:LamG domain-containing protein [Armatimonadota bacterium]
MLTLTLATLAACCLAQTEPPLVPFIPDEHTLLLYHFDEGEGDVARDMSGRGYDGRLRGPEWTTGKFGGALWFDGKDDSVFREVPEAIQGLKQLTVECWFSQEATGGRRFLVGQDVGFHFEVADGAWSGLSIYNQGGSVPNAEGKPHQQLGAGLGSLRTERWHHLAATYDGAYI